MTTRARLGNVLLPFNPNSVSWDFEMKVGVTNTIGGRVVQVFGSRLGDMSMSGSFDSWERQEAFFHQVRTWVDQQNANRGRTPLRFTYAPKNWDFNVLIRALSDTTGNQSVTYDNQIVAPKFQLVLFVVQDNVGNVVSAIKDAYIARLVDGVGFKTGSPYNGPADTPANALGLLQQDFEKAAVGSTP